MKEQWGDLSIIELSSGVMENSVLNLVKYVVLYENPDIVSQLDDL